MIFVSHTVAVNVNTIHLHTRWRWQTQTMVFGTNTETPNNETTEKKEQQANLMNDVYSARDATAAPTKVNTLAHTKRTR